jgi:hypothetical protein
MKVLMENWRSYLNEPQYDISPQFAAGSLGLEVPLNESYPYSSATLNKKVVSEYLAFNTWFDDLWLWEAHEAGLLEEGLKDWAVEKWNAAKSLAGKPLEIMKMIWKLVDDGKAQLFWKSLQRKAVDPLKKKLFKFLDVVTKYREKVPKLAKWAEAVKSGIEKAFQKLMSEEEGADPFVIEPKEVPTFGKIAGVTLTIIGMAFIWNKIKEMAEDVMGAAKEQVVSKLGEWAAKIALDKALKVASDLATAAASTVSAGIPLFVKKVAEWASFMKDAVEAGFSILEPVAAMFKSRGGLDEEDELRAMQEAIKRTQLVLTQ